MICKKCGSIVADGQLFCTVCGEKTEYNQSAQSADAPRNENGNYGAPNYSQNNAAYGNYGNYQNGPAANYGGGYYASGAPEYPRGSSNEKAPAVKDYLKWTLLYPLTMLIPGIGFIIYIVICFKFAFDNTFVGRANFFKATLITQAVALAVSAVVFIFIFAVFGSVVFAGFEMMDEISPEVFYEFSEEFNFLKMFLIH